jgi:hypothetical protein
MGVHCWVVSSSIQGPLAIKNRLEKMVAMARSMNWTNTKSFQGWSCSDCEWNLPVPTLLSDPAAKSAYDRLSAAKFADHDCASYLKRTNSPEPASFTQRMRQLVSQGFKPKDAADIVLQEAQLEHRGNEKILARAEADAQDFLRRVREGLI